MQVGYISALRDTIKDIMLKDRASILMGMNISSGGLWGESRGLDEYVSQRRIIDTPYSIPSIIGSALGLSMSGARPIVTIKGEYLLKAADVIANKVAISDYITNNQFSSDVLIISEIDIDAQKGAQGVSIYESVFSQIHGLKVIAVSSAADVSRMVTAAYDCEGPVLVLLCTQSMDDVCEENTLPYEMGSSQILREGEDVTVITYGPAVKKVLMAADEAAEMGVSCEVIDVVCLSDIDIDLIEKSVIKTAKAVVVHDSRKNLGIASEVVSKIVESEAFFYLEDKILRVCAKDAVVPYSKDEFKLFVPSKEEILDAIVNMGK